MTAITFVSDKQFKQAVKVNDTSPNLGVYKGFPCQVKIIDEKRRLIDFVISTECVDRMWDKICVKGWELENYLLNPVVLFGHDHRSPPIAKTTSLSKHPTKKTLEARAEFASKEVYPFADMIFNLYLHGFMKATSVGFRPLEYKFCDDDEERKNHYGIDFMRQELLEYSAVSVPANPEALIDAKSKGIDLSPLKSWTSEVLDDYEVHTKGGLVIPRKTLEQMYKHAGAFGRKLVLNKAKVDALARENLEKIRAQSQKLEGEIMSDVKKSDEVKDLPTLVKEFVDELHLDIAEDVTTQDKSEDEILVLELEVSPDGEKPVSTELSSLNSTLTTSTNEDEDPVWTPAGAVKSELNLLPLTDEDKHDEDSNEDGGDCAELTLDEGLVYLKTDTALEDLIEFISAANTNTDIIKDSRYVHAISYVENLACELLDVIDTVLNSEKELAIEEVGIEKQIDKETPLCQDDQEFDLENFVSELEKEEVDDSSGIEDFDIDEDFLKETLKEAIKNIVDVEVRREVQKLSGKFD